MFNLKLPSIIRLPLFFAWRYFKSKKTINAVQIIAWISAVAILVGSASLLVVLSVFNGFEDMVKGLYADFYADIKISPSSGKRITLSENQINQLKKLNSVKYISLGVEEKAVLVNGDYRATISLKGIEENYQKICAIDKHIIRGKFDLGTSEKPFIIAGAGVENAASLDVLTSIADVTLYLPNRKAKSANLSEALNSFNVTPVGSFLIQSEFDNKYVFTNLAFLKYMLDFETNEYSYAELSLVNINATSIVQKEKQQQLGKDYIVQTRYQQNQSLFAVMTTEKWIIYGILSLILIIASFNMIGALSMLVLEKEKDTALLKAVGASTFFIQNIFLFEGIILAIVGGLAGIALGSVICFIQLEFHIIKLGGATFLIDYYPVQFRATDFILILSTILLIALLASLVPARKAALSQVSLKGNE